MCYMEVERVESSLDEVVSCAAGAAERRNTIWSVTSYVGAARWNLPGAQKKNER